VYITEAEAIREFDVDLYFAMVGKMTVLMREE